MREPRAEEKGQGGGVNATPELAKALNKAQAKFPPIPRTKTVRVETKTGAEYTFTYAPLDSIRDAVLPALTETGLSYSQLLTTSLDNPERPALRTMLLHESGESIESTFPLPVEGFPSAQEYGSLITYFRRYALVALLGIATEEDDDGNRASGNTVAGGQEATAPRQPSPPPASNPAETAQAAYEATRTVPTDDGDPKNVEITFGKHKGLTLGQVPDGYIKWLIENFEARNPEQRRVLEAAHIMVGAPAGASADPIDDIPFAPVPV